MRRPARSDRGIFGLLNSAIGLEKKAATCPLPTPRPVGRGHCARPSLLEELECYQPDKNAPSIAPLPDIGDRETANRAEPALGHSMPTVPGRKRKRRRPGVWMTFQSSSHEEEQAGCDGFMPFFLTAGLSS